MVFFNPHLKTEHDTPYIFATLYDLKVDATAHQSEIEKIWFQFVSEKARKIKKGVVISAPDYTDSKVREAAIERSTQFFDDNKSKIPANSEMPNLGIEKPSRYLPSGSIQAKMRIQKLVREAIEQNSDCASK